MSADLDTQHWGEPGEYGTPKPRQRPTVGQRYLTEPEQLDALAAAQSALIVARLERDRAFRYWQRHGQGMDGYVHWRIEQARAITRRDVLLQAFTAHRLTWCHDSTACPFCLPPTTIERNA